MLDPSSSLSSRRSGAYRPGAQGEGRNPMRPGRMRGNRLSIFSRHLVAETNCPGDAPANMGHGRARRSDGSRERIADTRVSWLSVPSAIAACAPEAGTHLRTPPAAAMAGGASSPEPQRRVDPPCLDLARPMHPRRGLTRHPPRRTLFPAAPARAGRCRTAGRRPRRRIRHLRPGTGRVRSRGSAPVPPGRAPTARCARRHGFRSGLKLSALAQGGSRFSAPFGNAARVLLSPAAGLA